MKKKLTRWNVVKMWNNAMEKIIKVQNKSKKSLTLKELKKATKLTKVRLLQVTLLMWLTGVTYRTDPLTKKIIYPKKKQRIDDYIGEFKNWVLAEKNDAEYLFSTIRLFPGSTFSELGALTEFDENNLCAGLLLLCDADRIGADNSVSKNDEMYFPKGLLDRA